MRPVRRALDPCLCRIRRQPPEAVGVLAAQSGIELDALPPVLVRAGFEEGLARQVVREGPSEISVWSSTLSASRGGSPPPCSGRHSAGASAGAPRSRRATRFLRITRATGR